MALTEKYGTSDKDYESKSPSEIQFIPWAEAPRDPNYVKTESQNALTLRYRDQLHKGLWLHYDRSTGVLAVSTKHSDHPNRVSHLQPGTDAALTLENSTVKIKLPFPNAARDHNFELTGVREVRPLTRRDHLRHFVTARR
ncbi:MAG: hypothetical protein QF632_05185 [Candidatus Woesearchaeota archaeon]|nr:hypothetical protein [Candidatus Woesearchaeota archaeon]MDP7324125.1 hypothetical protein [Candidatus Woesearchaeota archaeon]MDP7458176.1 hypothetical protein [Candidatus Woesearchaeota archaeon]|tara:strand:- start:55 stop:474 length:420 start_codon:yes stop_codon:yes gene_type:complete